MKALLAAVGLLLATSPVPATVVSSSTVSQSGAGTTQETSPALTPWTGDAGITETVAEIMERARRNGDSEPRTRVQEIEAQEVEVDRDDLPMDPASPQSAIWPLATGERAGLSPIQAGTSGPGGPNLPQTVGLNFLCTRSSESGFVPPDTVGSVGPTQVLVCSNGRIKVFDKVTTNVGGLNATTNTFFSSVWNGSTTSDPQVKYDRLSGRWIVTMINVTSPNRIMIAVSSGSTITSQSSFTFFQFTQDQVAPTGNTGQLADYPKVGVDANAIVIGADMFAGQTYAGTSAWVIRKSSVLGAGPIVVTALRGLATASGNGPFAPSGVDNDDPAATVSYIVGTDNAVFGRIVLRRISDPGGSPTVSGNLNVTVPTTTNPIPQPALGATTGTLDALDDRLFACQIHKNRLTGTRSLWTAHNIQVDSSGTANASGGRNGSRWYEIGTIDTTPSLVQSGTLFDSSTSNPRGYWIPSMAISGQGHAVLGTSYANATVDRPGVACSGRLSTDALGTIQAPTLAVVSTTNYTINASRWGDYSAIMVDPTDDQTLWAFGEYCNANSSWGVQAIQLKAPPPATPTTSVPSTVAPGQSNVTLVITGTSASGSGFYDTEAGMNRIAAAFSGTGITVNSIAWTDGSHISVNVSVSGAAASGPRSLTITNPDGQIATSSSGIVSISSNNDCNGNGIPDNQDIANGTSQDCDANGVPDECQTDSDGDGRIDACDGCPNDPAKTAPGQCGCGVPDTDSDGDGTANCHDGCPNDPNKIAPGICGCGVADTDSDGDGTPNCNDGCPNDPAKTSPGQCGCGVADTDSDGDGTANCHDGCPNDPNKIAPGVCGCGVADTDSDGDGTPNCNDGCPNDPAKTSPGQCGCGVPDTDSDGDGTANCHDNCPNDPNKINPGICGCGVADTDSDGDGTPNCHDGCPNDPAKTSPGQCGCGVPDTDSDGDGTANCHDGCPNDPAKTSPGQCGCGVPDTDSDGDGTANCHDGCPNDPLKTSPGQCGCGVPDTDSDGDGTPNCHDGCPNDPAKTDPGQCGCGVPDTDSDGDGTANCHDGCPNDPAKTSPGICGCGVADTDSDGDGTPNCVDGCPNDPNKQAAGVCGCGVADVDTDGDGVDDCVDNCPSIANPGQEDCDGNHVGDACDIAAGAPDCNGNGVPDSCDIASGTSADRNGDGIPDSCQVVGLPYCFGDGTSGACPCGNAGPAGSGCANSVGQAARLEAVGTTSPDDLVLVSSGELPSALTIFAQGTQSTTPHLFGDGLRCVGGSIKRLYSHNASGGIAYAPRGSDLPIQARSAALGDTIPAGGTRYYWAYYRDPNATFCTAATFNASNAVEVHW